MIFGGHIYTQCKRINTKSSLKEQNKHTLMQFNFCLRIIY